MLSVSKQLLLDTERATVLIKKADSCKDTYKFDEYCAELYMILDRYDRYIKSYNNERERTDLGKDLYNTLGIKSMYEEKNEDTYRLACNGHNSVNKYLESNKEYINEFRVKETIHEVFVRDTKNMVVSVQRDVSDILGLHLRESDNWIRNIVDIKYELISMAGLAGANAITSGMTKSVMARIADGTVTGFTTLEALGPVALGTSVLAITLPFMFVNCVKIIKMIKRINDIKAVNSEQRDIYYDESKDPSQNKKTCLVIRDNVKFKRFISLNTIYSLVASNLNYIKSNGKSTRCNNNYHIRDVNLKAMSIYYSATVHGNYLEYIEYLNLINLTVLLHKKLKKYIGTYELYNALKNYLDDETEALDIYDINTNKLYQALKNCTDDKTETDINIIKLEA